MSSFRELLYYFLRIIMLLFQNNSSYLLSICAIFLISSKIKLSENKCPVFLGKMDFVEISTARTFLDVDNF